MAPPADRPATGAEAGRAARKRLPRGAHGRWAPAEDRADPVALLAAQDRTRVPALVPVRYGRMLESAFTFYRGAAAIMAADLGAAPDTGLTVQLCGDAHLSNFGVFQAPDRHLVFDVNDFDETLPGPFEWDVKRLAASFEIGGRDRGFDEDQRQASARAAAGSYRRAMAGFAAIGDLELWYTRLDVEEASRDWVDQVSASQRRRFDRALTKARNKDSLRALAKLTEDHDGRPRIADRPPVLVPLAKLTGDLDPTAVEAGIRRLLDRYAATLEPQNRRLAERYRYEDAGHKVVGVGSVGTHAWIVLLLGELHGDPLFLQVKEASASVLEPYAGASAFAHHGQRVVVGQRLMQATGDVLLGWLDADDVGTVGERQYYVRQLWDGKGSAAIEAIEPEAMVRYAELCGWTLARAHARSGDRAAIAAYLGGGDRFDRAMVAFAAAYADRNEADHRALLAAEQRGAIAVERGV
ncbi:DUF2252 domain-containing protein [Patulibacter defluvii]|uniref:DUF2252 domain-containing protein n=1 Tax=Patulibacter defluvii TaxID=3095358 RepID=UPI002A75E371|nr:DUF2252 domain-containing protein [Patulibacter sp. DM4]